MKRVLCVLTLLLGGLSVSAQQGEAPTLFVAPLNGDETAIEFWQPALGEGLAEMLITELGKTGKFQVLESTALEELKSEINLGEEGWVASDEKVAKGGWAGRTSCSAARSPVSGPRNRGSTSAGSPPKAWATLGSR